MRFRRPCKSSRSTADRKIYRSTCSTHAAPLRLPPLVRDLQFDFTALSLVAPEKVRFRYKLEGRTTTGRKPATERQAFYTNLPSRHLPLSRHRRQQQRCVE